MQILQNYYLDLFEDEIHNMNKTKYSDFHTYTKAKSAFILAEERLTLEKIKINSLSR